MKSWIVNIVKALVVVAIFFACVPTARQFAAPSLPPSPWSMLQKGKASFYSDAHHGNLTASGSIFNMHALTAAHKTLPFGTRVRVVNRWNGKAVVVRITDRGPFVKGRVIDLSHRAAKLIGLTGVAPVLLQVENTNGLQTNLVRSLSQKGNPR